MPFMEFLTPAAVQQLTGRRRRTAQKDALNTMGIPYLIRPDGSLAVSTCSVNTALGVKHKTPSLIEPDFEALYRAQKA